MDDRYELINEIKNRIVLAVKRNGGRARFMCNFQTTMDAIGMLRSDPKYSIEIHGGEATICGPSAVHKKTTAKNKAEDEQQLRLFKEKTCK